MTDDTSGLHRHFFRGSDVSEALLCVCQGQHRAAMQFIDEPRAIPTRSDGLQQEAEVGMPAGGSTCSRFVVVGHPKERRSSRHQFTNFWMQNNDRPKGCPHFRSCAPRREGDDSSRRLKLRLSLRLRLGTTPEQRGVRLGKRLLLTAIV